jgi:hypothetical protein
MMRDGFRHGVQRQREEREAAAGALTQQANLRSVGRNGIRLSMNPLVSNPIGSPVAIPYYMLRACEESRALLSCVLRDAPFRRSSA